MTLKYRELKRRYELDGAEQTVSHLSEALREGHLKPEDFSVRDLAEALVPDGREWDIPFKRMKMGWAAAMARLKVYVEKQMHAGAAAGAASGSATGAAARPAAAPVRNPTAGTPPGRRK